jgi:hypothetical protein
VKRQLQLAGAAVIGGPTTKNITKKEKRTKKKDRLAVVRSGELVTPPFSEVTWCL